MGKRKKIVMKKKARKAVYEMSYTNHFESLSGHTFEEISDERAKKFAQDCIAELRKQWKNDHIRLTKLVRVIPVG